MIRHGLLATFLVVILILAMFFPRDWERFGMEDLTADGMAAVCAVSNHPSCPPKPGKFQDIITGKGQFKNIVSDGPVAFMDKIFFRDAAMKSDPSDNSSDPYYIEKVVTSVNDSSLRVTINDDANESMQIWGNSCGHQDCFGPGAKAHHFQADGHTAHRGGMVVGNENIPPGIKPGELQANSIKLGKKFVLSGVGDAHGNDSWLRLFGTGDPGFGPAGNYYGGLAVNSLWTGSTAEIGSDIIMNNGTTLYNKGRMHIHGGELLYLLNRSGVVIGKEGGGNGNLSVQGTLCLGATCIDENALKNLLQNASQKQPGR